MFFLRQWLVRYGEWLSTLRGWHRWGISCCLGAGAALAFPPVYALPFLFLGFTGFYFLLECATTKKQAFFTGWWFGLGFFVTGLYWICISLLVEPEKFLWLMPFALLGLNGLFALYPALSAFIFYVIPARRGQKPLLLALCWCAMEYLRGHLFTGFPWNLAGYVWSFSDVMVQPAAYIGIYGLSSLTILWALTPVLYLYARYLAFASVALLLLCIAGGVWRLQAPTEYVDDVMLRLVQPNIEQRLKWDPKHRMEALGTLLSLTHEPGYDKITHVIWPETAVPFYLEGDLLSDLAKHIPQNGMLITGAIRVAGEEKDFRAWNSVHFIGASGKVAAIYDKSKLVPFGEFVPFRNYLPLEKITPGGVDFSRGNGPETLQLIGAPSVSVMICYEAIFPELAVNKKTPPSWLLNLTNDAWFGVSTGPYQHLAMARMRAVEQGLPLVRVANTGITALFDSYGRSLGIIPLNQRGILDVALPQPVHNGTTSSR